MGSIVKTTSLTHNTTCNIAEGTRQVTVAGAAQSAAGQVVINNAEATWARAVIASADANNSGFGAEPARTLLRSLGTGGT
jgi:hypothetical protein